MTDVLSSFAVPCASCGALLPVRLGAPLAPCRYCGASASLASDQLERLTRHVAELQFAGAEARKYQEGAGVLRASRRHGGLYFLVFLGPAFVVPAACWVFEKATGLRCVIELLGMRYKLTELVATVVPLASAALAGLLILHDVTAARRGSVGLLRQTVGVSRCTSCGATVPVALGRHTACPFCGLGLAPGEDAARRIEGAAGAQVAKQYAEYSRQLGDSSGMPQVGWPKEDDGSSYAAATAIAVGSVLLMGVLMLIAWLVSNR